VVAIDLNLRMLEVAALACAVGSSDARISWCEASATSLPLSDATFDIAYCQLGLQFFADRPGSLREMARVLVSGGRLCVMVWASIDQSPGFVAFADALARHVSREAAAFMHTPFSLPDAEALRTLLAGADFHDITVNATAGAVRFPSITRFVQDYIAATPLVSHVARAPDEVLAALIDDIAQALRPYVTEGALVFPISAHLARATR
jgi:ubiquinone/menaquinone biosynthesis C-methylase UbiE